MTLSNIWIKLVIDILVAHLPEASLETYTGEMRIFATIS